MFDSAVVYIILIVIVAAIAAVAGYVVGRSRAQQTMPSDVNPQQVRALTVQLEEAKAYSHQKEAEHIQEQTRAAGLQEQLEFVKMQLAKAQRNVQEQQEREQERMRKEAQAKQEEQRTTLEEQNRVLEAIAPVQKNIDLLAKKVSDIESGRQQEMGKLSQQLQTLGEQQLRLDKETSSLASALRNNKVRGAWGEAQLRNIVESAGLIEHVDFDTQVVVKDVQGNTSRPDMIIHLPGGKTIPIDAKVPYADYQRACEIPDTASEQELKTKQELLQAHAKALREHVKTLSDKSYWNLFDAAPDFVIAFIPNEALLQAALETDPQLMDDAFKDKVALTSPVTLWAVLKSVAYAWQQQTLTEDAKKLFDVSRELFDRFVTLGQRATKLGQSVSKTVTAYNQFAACLESRVLVSARKLGQLDPSKTLGTVEVIAPEQSDVRELTAPEVIENSDDE